MEGGRPELTWSQTPWQGGIPSSACLKAEDDTNGRWAEFWRTVKEAGLGDKGQLRVLETRECFKSWILRSRLNKQAAWTRHRPGVLKEGEPQIKIRINEGNS